MAAIKPKLSARDALPPLPLQPLYKIRPGGRSTLSAVMEMNGYAELIYFMIWRDLKVRYKQTVLGLAWVILQPLLMAIIFTVFMSKVARVPTDGVPYPLFAYAGLLPWMFFSSSVSNSSYALLANSQIISKVYLPRLILPLTIVVVRLIDFLISFVILFCLMFYFSLRPGLGLLLVPLLIFQVTLLSASVGLLCAVLNVKFRDLGTLLPPLLQVWMFASPIIYPSRLVPREWFQLYSLNPMVGITEGLRSACFGLPFDVRIFAINTVVIILLFGIALHVFCRSEEAAVDLL